MQIVKEYKGEQNKQQNLDDEVFTALRSCTLFCITNSNKV